MKLAVAAIVALLAASGAARAENWTIVPPQEKDQPFHADELPAKPAPGGFALVVVNGLWNLVPATLRIQVDGTDSKGQPDVVHLVAAPPDALYYLRAPGLVAGKVDTPDLRFKGVRRDAFKPIALPFKGTPWAFEIKAGATWFTDGKLHQQIYESLRADESDGERDMESASLEWAGDLDHDGRLDFIVDRSFDDGGTTCLWLSSRAKPGQLVGEAGCQDHHF